MLRGCDVIDQRHRLRIPAPRTHPGQPLTITDGLERPPVRQMHAHAIDRNSPGKSKFKSFSAERTVVLAAAPGGAYPLDGSPWEADGLRMFNVGITRARR